MRQINWIAVLLIGLLAGQCACTSVADIFRGNTRKTIMDYDLHEKAEYRRYLNGKKLDKRHQEQIIIEAVREDKEPKARRNKRYKKPRRTLLQKLLKIEPK